jgi:hypothetical protein
VNFEVGRIGKLKMVESACGDQFCHLMIPENLQNRQVRFVDVPPVSTFHNLYIKFIISLA